MAINDIVQVIAEARVDARSLSEFVFKPAGFMVTRRLAPSINTLEYYLNHFRNVEAEGNSAIARANNVISAAQASANTAINNIIIDGNAQISNAISNAGFVQVGTFAAGATLANRNDVIQASDGKLYRWGGSLPKTVAASSTPENSGGFGSNAWLEVSDASLAQKLAGVGGASIIGNGVSVFNNMAEFLAADSQIQDGSKVFLHSMYQGLDLGGEGRLYTYSKTNPKAVGLATGDGHLSRDFDGKVFIAEFGAVGGVASDIGSRGVDSNALQQCFDVTRSGNGGVISMGIGGNYHLSGVITADCNDVVIDCGDSNIHLGRLLIRWHPKKLGYGAFKNVVIKDGVWIGNLYDVERGGSTTRSNMHIDFGKVDNIEISGNTFIESNYQGHIADLLGSRYVYFEGNKVLGSVPHPSKLHNEVVQLDSADITLAGVPIETEDRPFFDKLPATNVYVRGNEFLPYTNPETGVTTECARPMGGHTYIGGFHDVYFEDNLVRDVVTQTGTIYAQESINLFGHKSHFNRNTIVLSNGNAAAFRFYCDNEHTETHGIRAYFEAKDNVIRVKNASGDSSSPSTFGMVFNATKPADGKDFTLENNTQGYDLVIEGNDIEVDISSQPESKLYSIFYIQSNVNNFNIDITSNRLKKQGVAHSSIRFDSGYLGARVKSAVSVVDNQFRGDSCKSSEVLVPFGPTAESEDGMSVRMVGNTFYTKGSIANISMRGGYVEISDNTSFDWNFYNSAGDEISKLYTVVTATPFFGHDNYCIVPKEDVVTNDPNHEHFSKFPRQPFSIGYTPTGVTASDIFKTVYTSKYTLDF